MGGRRKLLIRIGAGVAAVLCLAMLIVAAGWLYLQTETGQRRMADLIGQAASDETVTLRIGSLTGSLPGAVELHDIVLTDRTGPFLRIDRLSFTWRPLALLAGRLAIDRLAFSRIRMERLPASGAASARSTPTSFRLPSVGLDIEILQVAATEIDLGAAVAGVAARFSIEGRFGLATDGSTASLRFDARRIDGIAGRAVVALDYAASPARFAATATVNEAPGGPLVRLLGIPGAPALSVRIDGTGPPDSWRGRLTASAAPVQVYAGLSVAVTAQGLAVDIEATGHAGPLLPPALVPLLGPATRLSARVSITRADVVAIERLAIEGGSLRITAAGQYAIADDRVGGEVRVASHDALALPPVRLAGLRAVARLSGSLARPRVSGAVTLTGVALETIRVAAIDGKFGIAPGTGSGFAVTGSAQIKGLDPGPAVPAGLFGDAASLQLVGALGPDGAIAVSTLTLASGPLAVELNGNFAAGGTAQGSYRVSLARLAPLARTAGMQLDGTLQLAGDFTADLKHAKVRIEAGGELDGMRVSPSALATMIGTRVPIVGAIERGGDGSIEVIGLSVGFAAGTLYGAASISGDGATLTQGRIEAIVPDLARFAPLAGLPLAGGGRLVADLAGPFDNLAGQATLRLDRPQVDRVTVGHLGIGLGARWRQGRAVGAARFALVDGGRTIPGSLRFALDDKALHVSDIAMGKGGNRLSGDIRIARATGLAEGRVSLRVGDLAAMPLAGLPRLSGALSLDARLEAADGQRIGLSVEGTSLGIGDDGITVAHAIAKATVNDAFGARHIVGTVDASDLRAGGATIIRTKVEVAADGPNLARFSASLEGSYGVPLVMSFAGSAASDNGGYRAEISRLAGNIDKVKISTTAPARFVLRDGGAWTGTVAVSAAGGSVTASGAGDAAHLTLALAADRLPLSTLAIAAPQFAADGTLSARVDLAGPPGAVRGTAALSLAGVRPSGASWPAADVFAATAEGRLDGGALSLDATLTGPQATRLHLRARAPLSLSLGPLKFAIASEGPLSGSATIAGRLDLLDALIGLGNERISGGITGKIDIAGSVAAPSLRGSVKLSGGSYEGVVTGTVARDIDAEVRLEGSELRLVSFTARDRDEGRIAGSGKVGLDPAAGWPVDLGFTATRFAAIARQDASIRASGTLRLSGSAAAPSIGGRLQVDNGEIRIPDHLPEGITALDVVEINPPPDATTPNTPQEPSPSAAAAIPLDVRVTVPGRVFVRGRGLDSEWSGDLVIHGTTAEPRIQGRLSIVRGSFAFAGRNFVIRQGSVVFAGDGPPDPEIDARAELALGDIQAVVRFAGKASAPGILLSSTPPLPSDEILSRILFGKSFGQLTVVQAAQLAQSAAELSGATSGAGIVDRVRRTLGVDVLNVESSGESTRGAALKAGKYISDDVFVTVRQGATPDSQKVGVEIQLLPNLSVETNVGPASGSAASINWKWDY